MAPDSLEEDEITLDENRNLAEGVESQNFWLLVLARHQIDRLNRAKRGRAEQKGSAAEVEQRQLSNGS
jgi:phosphoenolpyruvate carboxylase